MVKTLVHRLASASRQDWVIAFAVFLAVVVLLLSTASAGFVRDEGYYFHAALQYHHWFEALWQALWDKQPWRVFDDATLRQAFGYNHEHPGLIKIAMGFTWKIFHVWLGVLDNATAMRLAAMGVVAVGCAFLYLFGARLCGRRVGVVAVALLLVCPRVFFHAHLAAFDGPIMAESVVVTYAFWRALESPKWVLPAAIAFGLALATKHNAVILFAALAAGWLVAERGKIAWRNSVGLVLPPLPLALLAMLLVGPLLLYVFYPYGWHAPIDRLGAYYSYHLHHENYPVEYFGRLLYGPPFPWAYPFVMTAITVPLTVLGCGVFGFGSAVRTLWRARRQASGPEQVGLWLVIVATLLPPWVIALPSVPIFGGTKHWMPAMPFFCLLGARWLVARADRIASCLPRLKKSVVLSLVGAVLALATAETVRTHSYGFTYFNELVGGHQGAAALGLPRGYWGGAGRALLGELNARAALGDTVFGHRMTNDDFLAYQRDGLLRSDLRWTPRLEQARWALIYHQREHEDTEYRVWLLKGDRRPVSSLSFDGVPIVSLYALSAP